MEKAGQQDQIQSFEKNAKKSIFWILLIVTFNIIGINLIQAIRFPENIEPIYPIIRTIELGLLSFLIYKNKISLKMTQLLIILFLYEILFERLLISPQTHMLYSSFGVLTGSIILAGNIKVFRVCTFTSILVLTISYYFQTIEFGGIAYMSLLFSYGILYLLGHTFISMRESVSSLVFKTIIEDEKYKNCKLGIKELEEIRMKIQYFLCHQSKFLHPEYSAENLAGDLGVSKTTLSQVLSLGMQTNFSQLLNEYRINEVKRRLKDPDFSDEKILSIALDCGFSSKSSFNMIFKKFTGLTPKEYRDS